MTAQTENKRAQYMRGELTFHEYYGLLVEHLGEKSLRQLLPLQRGTPRTPGHWLRLLEQDQHLNNVPLHQWDTSHTGVVELVRHTDRGALEAINGTGGWSLSDSVCVLKETARRYANS